MTDVAAKIVRYIGRHGAGSRVFAPKDFLSLGYGSRRAIDTALCRLAKAGKLRRVARGLYDRPRIDPELQRPATPNLDAVVDAIARRDGTAIMTDNMVAANVHRSHYWRPLAPAIRNQRSFARCGCRRSPLKLKHRPAKITRWATSQAAEIVQAFDFWGKTWRPILWWLLSSRHRRLLPQNAP